MKTRFVALLSLLVALSSTVVYGHTGHGTFDGHNLWHYITSPLHLFSSIAIIVLVAVLGVRFFTKKSRETK